MLRSPIQRNKNQPEVRVLHEGTVTGITGYAQPVVDARVSLDGRENLQAFQVKGRIWLVLSAFVLTFGMMAVRLADITLIGQTEQRLARFAPTDIMPTDRAIITDRNNRRLAMNRVVVGAAVNMRDVWDIEDTVVKLSTVFPDMDISALSWRLKSKKYVPLKEELSSTEKQALLTLGMPGLEFTENSKRIYPQGELAAHAIGYTVPGKGGVAGLERVINDKDVTGTLVSSLDIRAQKILEEELLATLQQFKAQAAWGVIMDVTTGEVIALSSLPSFNPNEPNASEVGYWRNRAMYDVYELGSAFKILTAAMALETGITTLDERFDVREPLMIGNKSISDYKPKGGFMTLSDIVQYSSNIGIAQVALRLGSKQQYSFLAQFGLTQPLLTQLPEARNPLLPVRWREIETATISYGHGIAVTPLQLTAAVAAVVNGGIYITPTFLKSERDSARKRILSEETSATMRLMLRQVVTDGTARGAAAGGYYVIGKTATADKPSPFGGYKKDERLSSFIGAFPGYEPRYIVLVSFDEPQPTPETYGYATAGIVAAPAFSRVVRRLAPLLGIQPVNDDLAFAKFMSAFKAKEEFQLAMNKDEIRLPSEPDQLDEMATLLSELGP